MDVEAPPAIGFWQWLWRHRAGRPRDARRPGGFIRSAGIRFAVIYAGVFGISSFTLAFSLWYATVGLLQHQVQLSVHNDVAALEEHYETGGPAALIGAVRNRIADSVGDDGIYLLHDPMGNRIAGNLDRWPKGLNLTGTWYQLVVNRKGIPSVALLWFETLPDGERLLVGRDMQARAELRTVLRDGLLWAVGLMSVLGLLGAVLIRSLFRRMIRDISATARAIALGDLTRRIPITGEGDEFEELADIINDMLDRIARLMDGVRQVSNAIAHDLRTPITRARTRLEDAAMHAQTKEDLHQAIERATDDLDGIVGVFEALLRIAEIEAGSRRAAFAFINLAPMLNDMDELYSAVAEERGLVLQSSIDPHLPMLGDRELVQQAVANLLDNALKFSKPGTTITLTAKAIEAGIEIAVADCGPGIAPQDRARATERFFRAESARSTSGSGLGLALVAAVAQLHNGAFSLSDNNPGLRARMLLPAKAEVGSPGRDED